MKNAGYTITKMEYYNGNFAIAFGEKSTGKQFVTWEYNKQNNSFFWGHYFTDYIHALKDYHNRLYENYNSEITPFEN